MRAWACKGVVQACKHTCNSTRSRNMLYCVVLCENKGSQVSATTCITPLNFLEQIGVESKCSLCISRTFSRFAQKIEEERKKKRETLLLECIRRARFTPRLMYASFFGFSCLDIGNIWCLLILYHISTKRRGKKI